MTTEILPKLEKLKKERTQYIEFQRIERDTQYYYQLFVIHQLKTLRKDREASNHNLEDLYEGLRQIEHQQSNNTKESEEIDEKLTEIRETIDQESGGQLKELQEDLNTKEKFDAELNNKVKSTQGNVADEEKKLRLLQKSFNDDEKALNGKKEELEKVQELFLNLKQAQEVDNAELQLAERRLEAASTGQIVGEDGEAATIQAQLMGMINY